MNAPRKKQVVALPDSHEFMGWSGAVKKHLNTALTIILLIAAIVLFVRWRLRSAEMAKLEIATELSSARSLVAQLAPDRYPFWMSASELLKYTQSLENGASTAISTVLTTTDADARTRAAAFLLRGDMYWYLGNVPPLPGSTTQPSLQMAESSDVLLQKSWEAYQEVLKNSTYADQHEALAAAHLGVAAIDENRNDWAGAKKEFEAVSADSNSPEVLVSTAKFQLNELPEIQKKLYIAPPSGPAVVPQGPAGPPAPAAPTTQFSIPGMVPGALPTALPTTQPFK